MKYYKIKSSLCVYGIIPAADSASAIAAVDDDRPVGKRWPSMEATEVSKRWQIGSRDPLGMWVPATAVTYATKDEAWAARGLLQDEYFTVTMVFGD